MTKTSPARVAANDRELLRIVAKPEKDGLVFVQKTRSDSRGLRVVPIQGGGKVSLCRRRNANTHQR